MGQVTYSTFFIATQAIFKGCKVPKRKPDFVSASGSSYWYGRNKKGDYVIRQSNHWTSYKRPERDRENGCGKIAKCLWHIKTTKFASHYGYYEPLTGKCYITGFTQI